MKGLVLSLFPGIGLLDMAFEEAGFCVVRGPDLLWGGDVRNFHPPAGRFDGVIGGPPCQAHSTLAALVNRNGLAVKPDRIPEFERCVSEAAPEWFLMENVRGAPLPVVPGYYVDAHLIRDAWCGGETLRQRRFSFGSRDKRRLIFDWPALYRPDPEPAALASGSAWDYVHKRPAGTKSRETFKNHKRLQGLPADFDLPPFTVAAKVQAVGNGVPLPMGRAVAAAVVRALESNSCEVAA
ncbi:MAG: DNA cytosine methyltransferase [Alphaproteobacteria bacterium]|nr:DNA cytosine methyltransferase [Alphaproteobacteria bacterium]